METILTAVDASSKITVYGDFDVDGVASTSILVGLLRSLGGACDWFIPDRISDGYGLSKEAIESIRDRGTRLIITVDCGVTSVAEVAYARELGMDVVVTDHHQPGPELPDCQIVHPGVSGYPFPELCGAAVAWKLACALRKAKNLDPSLDEADLDLVAMATVCDVMPLVGENRALVRRGVAEARRAERVGLKALLVESRVEPATLTSEDFGFKLGPRINAAGRMFRADAGVELFLSDSAERAAEIGNELGKANLDRRAAERELVNSAEAARSELEDQDPPALVVAGTGWHSGVVGIAAARLARKYEVPAVVISIPEDGAEVARGSARSVPGLDLHAAISECADLLKEFGGHKAAAGIQVKTVDIDNFRQALCAAVVAQIGPEPLAPKFQVDAIVGGPDLGLALAEDLEKLAPFGQGNRPPCLLVPAARITDIREIGDGKHAKFSLNSGGHRAAGISFGRTSFGVGEQDPVDVAAELSVNHWNGSVEPQMRLEEVFPVAADLAEPLSSCATEEWWQRFDAALSDDSRLSADPGEALDPTEPPGQQPGARRLVTSEGLPGVRIADLVSSGESLAIGTIDAQRRWYDLGGAAGLGRFSSEQTVAGLWQGSPASEVVEFSGVPGGVLLFEYPLLEIHPQLTSGYQNVATLDPVAAERARDCLLSGEGLLHDLAGPDEFAFCERAISHRYEMTSELRDLFRQLLDAERKEAAGRGEAGGSDAVGLSGESARSVLSGGERSPRAPERAALLIRVLQEVSLIQLDGKGDAHGLRVVSSEKVNLEDSPTFDCESKRGKEQSEFLKRLKKPIN